jgi:Protein of unknown function (DUF3891)
MIRIETDSGWILVEHREHARLAGRMAAHWGNGEFAAPEPRADVLEAVARHDDAWALRDDTPFLTPEGRPSAFSRELVGAYSAFEEMDFADYLAVRGRAAQAVAADNPYAAVIISMHTVSLLTTQADLSKLSARDLDLHQRFIEEQRLLQALLVEKLADNPARAAALTPASLRRAFEFLQACDSLSLGVCVRFPVPRPLRHRHPRRDGSLVALDCIPLGGDTYRIAPFPFDADEVALEVPCRRVAGKMFAGQAAFREAYAAAPVSPLRVGIVR